MSQLFEWDRDKARENLWKHGVSFGEAGTAFGDFHSITTPDPDHSSPSEPRFLTIGLSARYRLLVVIHCERKDVTRIISARKATKGERNRYEEEM